MAKKIFSLDDFRTVLERIIEGNRLNFANEVEQHYLETLNKLRQMSDDELSQAKLYADLGLDSLDVWEVICAFECDFKAHIDDEIDDDVGTGVNLNVEKLINAINANLVEFA